MVNNRFDSTRFQEYTARLTGCHPKQYNKITLKLQFSTGMSITIDVNIEIAILANQMFNF